MPRFQQRRLQQRLLKHHLPLFALSVLSVGAIYVTRPYTNVVARLSYATAYPALVLLAVTLMIGPWRLLRKKRNPVSDDLRRDLGIWTGLIGVLHSVSGQFVHLSGRPWLYYIYPPHPHHAFPLRHDLFGFANYTGLFGTLILLALLATSNDYFLRRLGTPQWKKLQRWNYALFALVAAHSFGYHVQNQKPTFVTVFFVSVALTLALQAIGFRTARSAAQRSPLSVGN
jgi:sulfoxide reductase heme-binding subunit YedZ